MQQPLWAWKLLPVQIYLLAWFTNPTFVQSFFVGHSCYLFIFSDLWLFSDYAHHHFLASPPTIHTHSTGTGVNCVQYFHTEGHRGLTTSLNLQSTANKTFQGLFVFFCNKMTFLILVELEIHSNTQCPALQPA